MKKITALLCGLLMVFSVFAFGACGEKDTRPVLKVATNAEFSPFEFFEGKKIVGIDIDIIKYIGDELGYNMVVEHMDFDSVIESLNGDYDLAIAGLTVSEERAKVVNFTDTYFRAAQYIIVKSTNTDFDAAETAADVDTIINGKGAVKIGFQNGTTGALYAEGDEVFEYPGYADADNKGFSSGGLAVQDLVNGAIEIVIIDEMPARKLVESFSGVKLIEVALTDEDYAIAVSKKHADSDLLEKINTALKKLIDTKKLDEIIEKFISTKAK